MQKLIVILLVFIACGCSVHESAAPSPVRQQFVPADSEVSGPGANWTSLVPVPNRPGAYWAHIHAGIGDTFPVKEQDGQKLFDVLVVDGDDDRIFLKAGSHQIDLPRDKMVLVQIDGSRYEWSYPTTYIDLDGPPTTDKAFLIITRLP